LIPFNIMAQPSHWPATGWLIKHYGWGTWYPTMAGFGLIGGCADAGGDGAKQRQMSNPDGGGVKKICRVFVTTITLTIA